MSTNDTYKNGPEGMPRLEKLSDSTIDWALNHIARDCAPAEYDRKCAHAIAEEILARLPAWPAAQAPAASAVPDLFSDEDFAEDFERLARGIEHVKTRKLVAKAVKQAIIAHVAARAEEARREADLKARDDVARALGLLPGVTAQGRYSFAWSYLLAGISECVKVCDDVAAAQPMAEAAAQADGDTQSALRAMTAYQQSLADALAAAPTAQPTPNPQGHKQEELDEWIRTTNKKLAQPTPPDDERAVLNRETNAWFPMPHSPHASVIERAKRDRAAFRVGWDARAALRQPGALPDEARYTLDEIAEACMMAEVSDSRFEAIGAYLAAKQAGKEA